MAEKPIFLFVFSAVRNDICFYILIFKNKGIFFRKSLDFCNDLCGIDKVDDENAKEHPDKKRKSKILRKPFKPFDYMRMNKKVINCAHNCPKEREKRTDDATDISEVFGIIPKPDFEKFNAENPRNVFNSRHTQRH